MWWIVAVAVVVASVSCSPVTDPVVSTNVGLIRGRRTPDGDYDMYLGIPYAQVDKDNPFGDNIPQPPFSNFDIFDAIDDSVECPQEDEYNKTLAGTLDCLHLNVYVPTSANPQNKLPVMVWIHGGSFDKGSKAKFSFGPKYLVRHDVIIVAINYRLGPYGFLCLDIPEVPGNQGLKDQQAALRWVKNNIAGFGGDNNNIIIAGQSAGSASVDLQLRFNKDDTFHKVIMESGSASSSWGIAPPDYQRAIKLASNLGYKTDNTREALKIITNADPLDVIGASLASDFLSRPCAEKQFDGVTRLIDDYAMNIDIPRVKDTPILLGVNNEESVPRYLILDEAYFGPYLFQANIETGFNLTESEMNEIIDVVKRFYLGGDDILKDNVFEIGKSDSDFNFIHPAKMSIDEYITNGAETIYFYLFSYAGQRNYLKVKYGVTVGDAFHADELGYLFEAFYLVEPNEEDQLMIDRMTAMWTNFMKYGNPTPEGATDLLPVKWPKVTADNLSYLSIDSTFTVSSGFLHERMSFWDLIYLIYYDKRFGYRPKK